ncbi:hypothetical protein AAMO2058_001672500 [Amorphochlora amoebiformis]
MAGTVLPAILVALSASIGAGMGFGQRFHRGDSPLARQCAPHIAIAIPMIPCDSEQGERIGEQGELNLF